MLKCASCIHRDICDADRFGYENCGQYHGHCKDCDEYRYNPSNSSWGCCVTATNMPEWGFCNFWEPSKTDKAQYRIKVEEEDEVQQD